MNAEVSGIISDMNYLMGPPHFVDVNLPPLREARKSGTLFQHVPYPVKTDTEAFQYYQRNKLRGAWFAAAMADSFIACVMWMTVKYKKNISKN